MISFIVGLPGAGKTMFLMREALRALKAGRDVYYNMPDVDVEKLLENAARGQNKVGRMVRWTSWLDFLNVENGLILVDEAQIYFNAYKWQDLPEEVQYKLQQHRKDGIDIMGAVQNVRRITTVMRELCNFVWEVKNIGNRVFIAKKFDVADVDKAKRQSLGFKVFFRKKAFADVYNTKAKIQGSKGRY